MRKAPITFLRDEPAEQDEFGSHDRLAAAISTVIREQPELKVIGLLGPWGSGKSTVVKLTTNALAASGEKIRSYCFFYDAWLHQNDPHRRAFLENLITFLIDQGLTTHERWADDLAKLQRQIEETESVTTPTLTTAGRWVLPTLFLVPLGMQLYDHDWFTAAVAPTAGWFEKVAFYIGGLLIFLPLIAGVALYLSWRPWGQTRGWKFFTTHKTPHQDESLLSVVMNKEVQRQRHRVIRNPDPTAIEFQGLFQDVLRAVDAPHRRLILVIDNLDRLPAADAVAIWTTIRSFFLGSRSQKAPFPTLPTVVLPIDETAIARIYDQDSGSSEVLARSFMEKTFDVTFQVTPPVLSGWSTYLTTRMEKVFGPALPHGWIHETVRLFEGYLAATGTGSVTPRGMNRMVNAIATLWLQWREEDISFVAVAYYAIFRRLIDIDILSSVTRPYAGIERLDTDWARAVAAMHFGVEPEAAIQVLMGQRLKNALAQGDIGAFRSQVEVPGFDLILRGILEQAAADPGDGALVINAARMLPELAPGAAWIAPAWSDVVRGFLGIPGFHTFDLLQLEALKAIAQRAGGVTAKVLEKTERLITAIPADAARSINVEALSEAFELVRTTALANELPPPAMTVPGDTTLLFDVLGALPKDGRAAALLSSAVPAKQLVTELVGALEQEGTHASVPERLKLLLRTRIKFAWAELANAAGGIVSSHGADYFAVPSAMKTLGLLRAKKDTTAVEQIKTVTTAGYLEARLQESYDRADDELAGSSIALLYEGKPGFSLPGGRTWETIFKEHPQLVEATLRHLREYYAGSFLHPLVVAVSATPALSDLAQPLATKALEQRSLGALPIKQVIAKFKSYLALLPEDQRETFAKELSAYPSFWEELAGAKFDDNLMALLTMMLSWEEPDSRAIDVALKAIGEQDAAWWEEALFNDAASYDFILAAADSTDKRLPTTSLYDALKEAIKVLVPEADSARRREWFELAGLLTKAQRTALMKSMRQAIEATEVADLASLLATDPALLDLGAFDKDPDTLVRSVLDPLLPDEAGRALIIAEEPRFRKWISAADAETLEFLLERIEAQEANDEEAVLAHLAAVRTALGLKARRRPRRPSQEEPDA